MLQVINYKKIETAVANSNCVKIFYCFQLLRNLLAWLQSLFWKEEMELTLVGLQVNSTFSGYFQLVALNRFYMVLVCCTLVGLQVNWS